ncbi:hypothetical protein BC829DRAFT_385844 [Chytridium lagenaria]|nr:hypothetical protein BC829DRAFT_385844 [Chytridium lagenaria]
MGEVGFEPIPPQPTPPEPLGESTDCVHMNAMFPFIPSAACCGFSQFLSYPDPYVDYNGDFNITCDVVTKRIVEIDMNWNFLETDPCSYTTCPEVTTLEAIGGLTEVVKIQRTRKALGNLRKLQSLQLFGSFYGALPSTIENLDALEDIGWSLTSFASSLNSVPVEPYRFIQSIRIPPEFGKLRNLKEA